MVVISHDSRLLWFAVAACCIMLGTCFWRNRKDHLHMSNLVQTFQNALAFHQQGQLDAAEPLYRQVLKQSPKHFDALHLLGVLQSQRGQHQAADELIAKAIKINPHNPAAYLNRGVVLHALKRYEDSLICYDRALAMAPNNSDALFNRGNALNAMKRHEEALLSYDRALGLNPNHPEAHLNRGNVLQDMGRDGEALQSYERALSLRPDYLEALISCSNLQHNTGNTDAALANAIRALQLQDTFDTRSSFFRIVAGLTVTPHNRFVEPLVIQAMTVPWGRPFELVPVMMGLIRQDKFVSGCIERANNAWPRRLSASELFGTEDVSALGRCNALLCLLENAQSADLQLERFLANVRFVLLDQLSRDWNDVVFNQDALSFCCKLAKQCFINEYVYYGSGSELEQAYQLRTKVESSLEAVVQVPSKWLALVACYFPLHTLRFAERLLERTWADAVSDLLVQQVRQPMEEDACVAGIPRLTSILDDTSLLVQQQYEENPYPRWIKYAQQAGKASFNDYLSRTFPRADVVPLESGKPLDILIAGCGTGHQAVDVAQSFIDANVMAVDLSLKSLSYAIRKTRELGIENIKYAQADIMALSSIQQRFDVIESVGVLHHMADPVAGWRALLSLLRPNGFMKLGFYSELARRDVVKVRSLVADRKLSASAATIQKLRHDLPAMIDAASFSRLMAFRDFFGTSECRDLLFHVQEHRFTLPAIREILSSLGLKFVGFQLPLPVIKRYFATFPEDIAATNLECWHRFEELHPDTFIGMYQFWVQKV